MSVGDSQYDRWQKKLREAEVRIQKARATLREHKNLAGRIVVLAHLNYALDNISYAANQIEDADNSCYEVSEPAK